MINTQIRKLSVTAIAKAGPPPKGKAQGFSRKTTGSSSGSSNSKRPAPKRIGSGTLYKKWIDTIHTAGFNKNAEAVELPIFQTKKLDSYLNTVVSYSNDQYKALTHLGAFKKNQYNELFPKPISLIRKDSTEKFINLLKESKDRKYILTGEPGVGKSVLLSQVQASAVDNNIISVHISYPELFLNGSNSYFYEESSNLYIQPMYLKKLIRKILKGNDPKLFQSLKLKNSYKLSNASPKDALSRPFVTLHPAKNSLFDLLNLKTQPRHLGEQFSAIISELTLQDTTPIYFTVDNFSRILTGAFSNYRNVENKQIYLLDLQLGKIIMDIVSGTVSFANPKSAVILSISGVDRTNRTLPIALNKLPHDPYITRYHYEPKFAELLQKGGVKEFQVSKLNKDEVRILLDFYLKSKIVLNRDVDNKSLEELTDEKYFLSGNGNPRELLKSVVLQHR
ncbi:mitochondrial 37S ribosomal protein mS29 NDAI_0I00820 [Naumovozyma dairenensis CBS 421]|uniref:Small ribosomal subunit protein mS29 n=1 Tax=Naumovozyma dairenensis (strain ATCC 10597 / BCRC 20456 / CBS 421 / NBRC 0211 / NRRL Y-12639) TaxID=1071378 RepID=G0WFU0_NAUDC|nr:hypothetical protein NDAI_0I00820 [Naumovozyma dairenensis CBS 421]CCD26651.1 hypothetical protein NDAI_0I00820 [Naumovozyma dairenensis CBS 421]